MGQKFPEDEKIRTIDAVDISIDILECLPKLDEPTVSNIADHLDLSPSTVYNHLATLYRRGYVSNDGYEYYPSLRFIETGERIKREYIDVYQPARDVVKHLAEETGEVAWLMVEENGMGTFILKEGGDKAVDSGQYRVGSRCPLHCSGPGKAILAHLSEEEVGEIIERHGLERATPNTIIDREELLAELEGIRDRGVAYSNEEGTLGTKTVATPILGHEETVLGSIAVSGPVRRMNDDDVNGNLPGLLKEYANIIEIEVKNG